MTASSAPILDYASPRAKSSFRIGTRSVLRTQRTADEFCVVESLEDSIGAIAGMTFAWLAMTPMICVAFQETIHRWWEWGNILLWVFPLAGAVTTFGVIQQTWGRTMLIVTRETITLRLVSPLRKMREHRWNTAQLRLAMAIRTSAGGKTFDELWLDFEVGAAQLFGGHRWEELMQIEMAIRQIANPPVPDAALADAEDSA